MSKYEGAQALTLDASGKVVPLPREAHVNYGSDPSVFVRPPMAKHLILQPEAGGPWKIGAGDHKARTFAASSGVDLGVATSHGYTKTIEGPLRVSNSGGTLPGGLAAATPYWLGIQDIHSFKFYATEEAALAASSAIDLTDNGTGTHTLFGPAQSVAIASADITNGLYAWPIPAAASAWAERVFSAPDRITVVGTAASDVIVIGWA